MKQTDDEFHREVWLRICRRGLTVLCAGVGLLYLLLYLTKDLA